MPSQSKPKREPAPLSSPLGHIAVNVRRRRDAMGLTQAELGELAQCHPTYVSQIERRVTNISVEKLEKFAKVFGVDALTLMQPPK
jgi:transcriptional regulator with XRE-family HTH domain